MRLPAALVVVALGLPGSAVAEQVVLKNGGRISGILVERSATYVVIQVGAGRVKLPLAAVERVQEGRSALAAFAERAQGLRAADRDGWLELGLWARDAGLETQARECFERVLALDPQNAIAQKSLGNVLLNGRWLDPEEAYRARGYVRFEGSWMLPEERDDLLRDRAARREQARARADSESRIAEARARAAESQAREADAAAGSGIPVWYGYGYGPYGVAVGGPITRHPRTGPRRPPATPPPMPAPPPSTRWGNAGAAGARPSQHVAWAASPPSGQTQQSQQRGR